MGRWGSVRFAIPLLVIVTMTAALSGCGSSATKGTAFPVPASIKLSPAETASMEVGSTLTFAGAPQNSKGVAFAEPVSYQSSNPAVLTIASNGLACAGTWNSLGAPQICTPGPVRDRTCMSRPEASMSFTRRSSSHCSFSMMERARSEGLLR